MSPKLNVQIVGYPLGIERFPIELEAVDIDIKSGDLKPKQIMFQGRTISLEFVNSSPYPRDGINIVPSDDGYNIQAIRNTSVPDWDRGGSIFFGTTFLKTETSPISNPIRVDPINKSAETTVNVGLPIIKKVMRVTHSQ